MNSPLNYFMIILKYSKQKQIQLSAYQNHKFLTPSTHSLSTTTQIIMHCQQYFESFCNYFSVYYQRIFTNITMLIYYKLERTLPQKKYLKKQQNAIDRLPKIPPSVPLLKPLHFQFKNDFFPYINFHFFMVKDFNFSISCYLYLTPFQANYYQPFHPYFNSSPLFKTRNPSTFFSTNSINHLHFSPTSSTPKFVTYFPQCHQLIPKHNIYLNNMDQAKSTDNREHLPDALLIEQKINLPNGQLKIKKYSKGKTLGRGGFAKCYEITNLQTKKLMAVKIIAKSTLSRPRAKQKLISEIKIHKSLSNPHIVKFQHVFQDHQNVYILLQICTNNTMNQLIKHRKKLTQIQAQYYISQIISALKYLHQNKVIHRDLKLGNLFINQNMEIKLGDFGLATKLQYDGQKKKTICGTPNYIAPQILQNKGHSYQVDIWSLGVILYTQLIGKPPFETAQVKATYKKIKQGSYTFPDNVPISQHAKTLIQHILQCDPSKRPTLDQIMQDPFMNSESIPKTMPKSTLTTPPPNDLKMQSKVVTTDTPKSIITHVKQPEIDKKNIKVQQDKSKNISLPIKQSKQTPTPANNFRNSSKDLKAPQHSFKQLPPNLNNLIPMNKKPTQPPTQKPIKPLQHTQIHVKKWVDYSTKYGLGYLLSDGSTGVYFNDSTKIILDHNFSQFQYIQKKNNQKLDTITRYSLTQYPQQRQLQKKVTLLQHFSHYLYTDSSKIQFIQSSKQTHFCYVKKWMKTKHAIMFRLSNKIVQVNFTDKTQIILSSQQKLVTYVNTKGQKSQYPLATALDSKNAQMSKRLKYAKQILNHMLNGSLVQPLNPTYPPINTQNNPSANKGTWNKS